MTKLNRRFLRSSETEFVPVASAHSLASLRQLLSHISAGGTLDLDTEWEYVAKIYLKPMKIVDDKTKSKISPLR